MKKLSGRIKSERKRGREIHGMTKVRKKIKRWRRGTLVIEIAC